MSRRGVTLVEVLAMLVPGVLVLGVAIGVMVRATFQGDWNAARLSSLDAVLLASESLRHEVRTAGAGAVPGERRAPGVRVTVDWADDAASLLRVRAVAACGRGPARPAPIALTTVVHVADRHARAEFASWADE